MAFGVADPLAGSEDRKQEYDEGEQEESCEVEWQVECLPTAQVEEGKECGEEHPHEDASKTVAGKGTQRRQVQQIERLEMVGHLGER